MKNLKKLGASLLALVLALGMVAPAMASQGSGSDNPPQPTQIKLTTSGQGHTFTAYQIFKAAGSDATSLNLETLDWGPSVTDKEALWNALVALDATGATFNAESKPADLGSAEGARAVADLIINAYPQSSREDRITANEKLAMAIIDSGAITRTVSLNNVTGESIDNPLTGYFAIKDEAGSLTTYMLLTAGADTTIKPKEGKSTVKKEVWDPTSDDEWSDGEIYSAEQAGDGIRFKLTVTLPDNFDAYKSGVENGGIGNGYNVTLHDTQGAGLSYEEIEAVNAYKSDGTLLRELGQGQDYTISTDPSDDCTFHIDIPHVENIDNIEGRDYIEVIYKASFTGNETTNTGANSNDTNNNKVGLEINGGGIVDEDNAKVFELELKIDKVNGDGDPLEGAVFTLYPEDQVDENGNLIAGAAGIVLTESKATDGTVTHNVKGLEAGTYWMVETAPDNYNPINGGKPVKIVINALTTPTEGKEAGKLTLHIENDYFDDAGYAKIENLQGTRLPETGGIGTTIFYIAGGALAIGAVVLLVTKRRVGSADDE